MVSFQRFAIPSFLKFNKDKEFLFNSRQQREALTNIDIKCFKIQTSDIGPPPPAGPLLWADKRLEYWPESETTKKEVQSVTQ